MRLLCILVLFGPPAAARFDLENRSVRGTGEALPEHVVQLDPLGLSYGLTSRLTLGVPFLPLAISGLAIEGQYRVPLGSALRLSPRGQVGCNYRTRQAFGEAGLTVGASFGDQLQHDASVGCTARFGPAVRLPSAVHFTLGTTAPPFSRLFACRAEYGLYLASGTLVYGGLLDLVPYAGVTWAFENVHLGFALSPALLFVPLPYVALRF